MLSFIHNELPFILALPAIMANQNMDSLPLWLLNPHSSRVSPPHHHWGTGNRSDTTSRCSPPMIYLPRDSLPSSSSMDGDELPSFSRMKTSSQRLGHSLWDVYPTKSSKYSTSLLIWFDSVADFILHSTSQKWKQSRWIYSFCILSSDCVVFPMASKHTVRGNPYSISLHAYLLTLLHYYTV